MSGGSHDYAYTKLNDIADSFDVYEPEYKAERKKVAKILKLMAEICHDIEWIDSSDYGEDGWTNVLENLNRITVYD